MTAAWRLATPVDLSPTTRRFTLTTTSLGGCTRPIRLVGATTVADATTGEVVEHFASTEHPDGVLLVACGDRRASVCPSCSATYQRDTYHLIRAGLAGGKGVPASVAEHPRVFATLTAPSFGPVHTTREHNGKPVACRPRRDRGACEHGRPIGCPTTHTSDDPRRGTPLCLDCFDYCGAILWNAHAGKLWNAFCIGLRRRLAAEVGITRAEFARQARVSFAKVAEFQRRGLVHLHAVIRLDGPSGASETPPSWASVGLLLTLVPLAAGAVVVVTSYSAAVGWYRLRFGGQVDVQTLGADDRSVAGYVAKYATKDTATDRAARTAHTHRLTATCWRLAALPEFAALHLDRHAGSFGYRGHVTTKSRAYSTTMTALRQARAEHQAGAPFIPTQRVAVDRAWHYAGRDLPVPRGGAR